MVLSTFRTRIVSIGRGYCIARATDFNQVLRDARLTLTCRAVQSAAMRNERQLIRQERIQAFQNDLYGHFTRKLDQALPQRHTLKLYNKLLIIDASILI